MTEPRRERLTARARESIDRYTEKENEDARQQQLVVHLFPICAEDIVKGVTLTRDAAIPTQVQRRESVLVV